MVMGETSYKIFSLGVGALTVEFGKEISLACNEQVIDLARYFEDNRFAGLIETVPAYSSLTVYYDVLAVAKNSNGSASAFETVSQLARQACQNLAETRRAAPRLIEIPVNFEEQHALDLDFVAARANLTRAETVEIFTGQTYRVFMLGFQPAFAYMGELDGRIAAPRKSSPRLRVPRGSVGIAGRQTGIYPFESPGGWQIIGKTDFELFTPNETIPCALQAGDKVRFFAVDR